ncbi:AAA family ATPase [Rouxiella sp. Mn2063]|uniref:AAA family ATPase n=1 Tax=Rouxiella sp. Mn2063 TaxID=3395262 RepID=UPI003BBD208C
MENIAHYYCEFKINSFGENMYLHKIKVNNFRKLKECEIKFEDATFLIGPNNAGKSSVFAILEFLHGNKNLSRDDFTKYVLLAGEEVLADESEIDGEGSNEKTTSIHDGFKFENEVEILAEYHNIPDEAKEWVGFKGRVVENNNPRPGETKNKIVYKKKWNIASSKPAVFMLEYNKTVSNKYKDAKTVRDLIGDDFSEEFIITAFGKKKLDSKLKAAAIEVILQDLPAYWDVDSNSEEQWVENPGGIPGNVLSKLPRVVIIPAESCIDELDSRNGSLHSLMSELFSAVRKKSENYQQAQLLLNNLAKELDPSDIDTDFGRLMSELNKMIKSIFPESSVHVGASLEDADKVIQPMFNVEMESNVKTPVKLQGHGMIRATAFQLYRFVHDFYNKEAEIPRSTIFCFEEPEIYLHPSAANQMRDALYKLAGPNCQIIATTHSPYMIDLSSDKKLSLTKLYRTEAGFTATSTFNLTEAFKNLQADEKLNLKMLLKVDDCISRAFFTNKCIFVEGDTEEVVFRETLKRLSDEDRSIVISNCEVLRGRGKSIFISIAKYFNALGINYIILHDEDSTVAGAEKYNPLILAQCGSDRRIMLTNCIEDVLNYQAPSKEKPYTAHRFITNNWTDYQSIPLLWRDTFKQLCSPYLDHL